MWTIRFFINSILLGVGLTMDAFSVSLANGVKEPNMKKQKSIIIAGTFSFFQFIMPLIGWVLVHTIVEKFKQFEKFIPWIALILLLYIGGKMIVGHFKKNKEEEEVDAELGFGSLLIQGIATSIDALSVGFTIAEYGVANALVASLIIAVITFGFCIIGVFLGKKFGTRFSDKSELIGGIILEIIGLEIFIIGVI